MLSDEVKNANIGETAKNTMASTALEFCDEVVKNTDSILIKIFERIESRQSTYEEEALLIEKFLKTGSIL